jgi:hypothetical protein
MLIDVLLYIKIKIKIKIKRYRGHIRKNKRISRWPVAAYQREM